MEPLYSATVQTPYGNKGISVYIGDATAFDRPIDVLTTSAFLRAYNPTFGTMFYALYKSGIAVWNLAKDPLIDLREIANVWLSRELQEQEGIRHIGCIELNGYRNHAYVQANEEDVIRALRAYFCMLDIAANAGVSVKTVALPMLGSGCQRISASMLISARSFSIKATALASPPAA